MSEYNEEDLLEAETEFQSAIIETEGMLALCHRIRQRGVSRDSVLAMESEFKLDITSQCPINGFTKKPGPMNAEVALEAATFNMMGLLKKGVKKGIELLAKVIEGFMRWLSKKVKTYTGYEPWEEEIAMAVWDKITVQYHIEFDSRYDDLIDDDFYASIDYVKSALKEVELQEANFSLTSKALLAILRDLKKAVRTKNSAALQQIEHDVKNAEQLLLDNYIQYDKALLPRPFFIKQIPVMSKDVSLEEAVTVGSILSRYMEEELETAAELKQARRETKVKDASLLLAKDLPEIDFKELESRYKDLSKTLTQFTKAIDKDLDAVNSQSSNYDTDDWDNIADTIQQVLTLIKHANSLYRSEFKAMGRHLRMSNAVYDRIIKMRLFVVTEKNKLEN